jgi:hypothetical protein
MRIAPINVSKCRHLPICRVPIPASFSVDVDLCSYNPIRVESCEFAPKGMDLPVCAKKTVDECLPFANLAGTLMESFPTLVSQVIGIVDRQWPPTSGI